jgi:hypothetical protein
MKGFNGFANNLEFLELSESAIEHDSLLHCSVAEG